MQGSLTVTSHLIQIRKMSQRAADKGIICPMAILTPIIMRKKVHFNTLVRHIGGDGEETQNRPRPSLILHSVMGRFAVELQGLNVVSVVKKPGDEVFHGFDSILLCIMA